MEEKKYEDHREQDLIEAARKDPKQFWCSFMIIIMNRSSSSFSDVQATRK